MSPRAVVGLALLATGSKAAYQCTSDVTLPMVQSSQKGLALDDTTFHWCPEQVLGTWPNTNEPVSSVRIFKAWQADWATDKHQAWQHIVDYATSTNAKVLMGTQISCDEASDDADWAEVSELLKMLGAEHIMGVSIGNELDLMWQDPGIDPSCVTKLWGQSYFQNKFTQRVKAIDSLFPGAQIPVTTVFSEYSLAGKPFVDDPTKAMVNTFLTNATKSYPTRYVHSLNLYPYFDMSNQYFNVTGAVARSACFQGEAGTCLFADVSKDMRSRMHDLTGSDNGKLWIAETGWSSPVATTLPEPMKSWQDYSSPSAFKTAYSNFLNWDMTLDASGAKGPDHVFYFTMRDAPAFGGAMEAFGLIGDELGDQHLCQETKCKIQSSRSTSPLALHV